MQIRRKEDGDVGKTTGAGALWCSSKEQRSVAACLAAFSIALLAIVMVALVPKAAWAGSPDILRVNGTDILTAPDNTVI